MKNSIRNLKARLILAEQEFEEMVCQHNNQIEEVNKEWNKMWNHIEKLQETIDLQSAVIKCSKPRTDMETV